MQWHKCVVAAFGFSGALIGLTHAQTIKTDTLEDLKAEYEFQQKELAPVIVLYQQAQQKRLECATRMFQEPLVVTCRGEDRELQMINSLAAAPIAKYELAKEAYEREQRKVDRNTQGKAAKR